MLGASSSKLQTHIRVLRALVRREITTRFARSVGGYFWAIAEPALFIGILTVVFSLIAQAPPLGDSFMLFFATGYIGFSFYRGVSDFASIAVMYNRTLLNFPTVSPYDAILARVYLEFVTLATSSVIVLTVVYFILGRMPQLDLFHLWVGMGLGVALATAVALCNAILFILFPTWQQIFGIVNRPLFIVSGVFFTPASLPPDARDIVLYNPIAHIVSIFRRAFYPEYEAPYVNYPFVIGLTLALMALGLYLIKLNRYTVYDE